MRGVNKRDTRFVYNLEIKVELYSVQGIKKSSKHVDNNNNNNIINKTNYIIYMKSLKRYLQSHKSITKIT